MMMLVWLLGMAWALVPNEDPLDLAGLLIRDGHWERAALALEEVTVPSDPIRFHTLRGLVHLQQQRFVEAEQDFGRVVAAEGPDQPIDPVVWLYLAQSRLEQRSFEGALDALSQGGEGANVMAEAWVLREMAHWELGETEQAWGALWEAQRRFPLDARFPRQRVARLLSLGLFQEATEQGQQLLIHPDVDDDDVVLLSESFRLAGNTAGALDLLERAHLEHPQAFSIKVALAYALLDNNQPLAAARLLQDAAAWDPGAAKDSAECYRQANRIAEALYVNRLVPDPHEGAVQRLGLLLESEAYAKVVAMAPRLERLGLTDGDSVRYGLAYAHFRLGDLQSAEELLAGIEDPRVFSDAVGLREALVICLDEPWTCW